MGRRGPAPKPTPLKILEGNPGKRKLNRDEPKPEPGCSMPTWLSASAKAEWRRIVPELNRLGLLTTVDRAALAGYCQTYADFSEAVKVLEKEGRYQTDASGVMRLHPAVKVQQDAGARLKAFLALFGLSPADRSRIVVTKADKPEGVSGFARKRG